MEPIQANKITCGPNVYVDLQTTMSAICFDPKVDTEAQANIRHNHVYDTLFGT